MSTTRLLILALASFVQQNVIVQGRVDEIKKSATGSEKYYVLSCDKMLFPVARQIAGNLTVYVRPDAHSSELFSEIRENDQVLVRGRLEPLVHDQDFSRLRQLGSRRYQTSSSAKLCCHLCAGAAMTKVSQPAAESPPSTELLSWNDRSPFTAYPLGDYLNSARDLLMVADRSLTACRQCIVKCHTAAIGPENGALLTSMVLGDRAIRLPKNVVQAFRNIGLSHILAASGFNLTVVIAMTYFIVRLINPNERLANIGALIAMIAFIALAGPSPSVIRAALMCTMVLISRLSRRKTSAAVALSVALLVTWIVSPQQLTDIGLQLSYAATGGIVCGARPFADWLRFGPGIVSEKIAEAVGLATVAQLSVLPIQIYYFWQTGLLFIVANLSVVPIVSPVTMLGFASSLVAILGLAMPAIMPLVQWLVTTIDAATNLPVSYMLWIANFLSSIEIARIRLGQPEPMAIAIYYFCLLAFFVSLRCCFQRKLALSLLLIGIGALTYKPSPPDLTIACLGRNTILINSHRDAVVTAFVNEQEARGPINVPDQDVASNSVDISVQRFLNFNAVRFVSYPDKPSIFGLLAPTFVQQKLSNDDTILCTDRASGTKVLIINGLSGLLQTKKYADTGRLFHLLQQGPMRILVIRLDHSRQRQPAGYLKILLQFSSSLVETNAIDLILFVQKENKLNELADAVSNGAMQPPPAQFKIRVLSAGYVQAILVSRNQLSQAAKHF